MKKGDTFLYGVTEYEILEVKDNWIKYQIAQTDIKANKLLTKYLKEEEGFTAVAKWFIACKKMTHRAVRCVREPKIKKSIDVVRLLCEKDGYKLHEVVSVLQFTLTDSFYKERVFSLTTLRTKSQNGLTKFENIVNSVKIKKKKSSKEKEEVTDYAEL